MILGIIPAWGGSVGVPRKNVRPLAGKPVIAYAIESDTEFEFKILELLMTERLAAGAGR